MGPIVAALTILLAAQRPVPSINYTLPGQATPAPPAPLSIPANAEILPFQSGAVLARPSPAARHFLLASAPPIPARGLTFTVRCLVDRAHGRAIFCQDATVPAPYRAGSRRNW